MKKLLQFALLCLLITPLHLFGQSSFIRSLELTGFWSKTAHDPLTGGFIHINNDYVDTAFFPVFLRLDAMGSPVQTIFAHKAIFQSARPVDVVRLAGGGYAAAWQNLLTSLMFTLDSTGTPIAYTESAYYSIVKGMEPSSDGGNLAVGYCGAQNVPPFAGWAVKFNAQGDTSWVRMYEIPNGDFRLIDAAALPSGDYILAAQINDTTGLMRVSASGALMWTKKYPTISGLPFSPKQIAINADGQILVGGGSYYAAAAAFDTLGNFQWGTRVQIPDATFIDAVALTPDGDLIMMGSMNMDINQQNLDFGINLCISKSGQMRWARMPKYVPGYNYRTCDVEVMPGGQYFWTGRGFAETLLYTTSAVDSMAGPCTPDPLAFSTGTFVLDTVTAYPATPYRNFLTHPVLSLTATSTVSSLVCAPVDIAKPRTTAATVLPQPLRTSARILLSEGSLTDDAQLHITDLNGRVLSLPVTRLSDGWEIQRGGLPAGIYAYQVLQGGQRVASGKLWIAD